MGTADTVWRLGTRAISLDRPRIMAIANATPDSFYAGSRLGSDRGLLRESLAALLDAGPDVVDLGGQSTRPGSERVGAEEELRRVLPALEELRSLDGSVAVTVDTYHASVAAAALASGADGVNDISAGRMDPELWPLVARRGCGYVLMHMQGTPESMQREPSYGDCVAEVGGFLRDRMEALSALGVARGTVVADPGVGFGKRPGDNAALVRDARRVADLAGVPLLYGISRKSFIMHLSGAEDAADRLPGTLGVTWELLNQGVMLHRVHDVAAVRQLCDVWWGIQPEK